MHKLLMHISVQYVLLILVHTCVIMCTVDKGLHLRGPASHHGRGDYMPIRYKVDVLAALKAAGFTSYKIRKEGLINQTALQRLRDGKLISWEQLATVCKLLNCQPGDLLEYAEEAPAEVVKGE